MGMYPHTILEYHLFLKKNRYGNIKERTLVGGNKQRDFISRKDSISPTVATESVLLTCIVDAEENNFLQLWKPQIPSYRPA